MLNPNSVPIAGIIITLIVVLVFIVAPLYLLSKLILWIATFRERKASATWGLPERFSGPVSPMVTAVFWTCFLGGLGYVFWFAGPAPHDVRVVKPAQSPWPPRLFFLAVTCYILYVIIRLVSLRDRLLIRSARRAQSGDVDGAIGDLRVALLSNPTAERHNALGALLIVQKNYRDAYENLLHALDMGLYPPTFEANMTALFQTAGLTDEALTLLERHVYRPRAELIEVCEYCDHLLLRKRFDAALHQIHRAERMFEAILSGTMYRGRWANLRIKRARRLRVRIDESRARLKNALAGKPALQSDEL